jgi:hypothetical protein
LYLHRVTFHYPVQTFLEEVLASATRQTGVPLRLDEGISSRGTRFRSGPRDVRLYEFMQSLADPGRVRWLRDGLGYRLVPAPVSE